MEYYVVVCKTCEDCNSISAKMIDHKPDEKELAKIQFTEFSGGICLSSYVFKLEMNGEMVEQCQSLS